MSIVFLNGSYMPMSEAKISPLDRGFLFGDSIYEVIPSYQGRLLGFGPHIDRMNDGFKGIGLNMNWSDQQWKMLCEDLADKNGNSNLGIYLQVSRGADTKRYHAFPAEVEPTVFGFTFEIPEPPVADKAVAKGYKVSIAEDLRWQRCHIKSTALLGNVLHFQQGYDQSRIEYPDQVQ